MKHSAASCDVSKIIPRYFKNRHPERFNPGSSQDIPYWIPAKNVRE
jgi:hypothetical protein